MPTLSLAKARKILNAALAHAEEKALKPLAIVVLDERGVIKTAVSQDGTSLMRFEIAFGKGFGALGMGVGSRTIGKMAAERPHFVSAYVDATGGRCVPVPGGVLIKDAKGVIVGAVGISGDTSDADEAAALAGIVAAGLTGDPGAA